jgi:hypothetical protein
LNLALFSPSGDQVGLPVAAVVGGDVPEVHQQVRGFLHVPNGEETLTLPEFELLL